VLSYSLLRGHTTSCGCLRNHPKPKERHGLANTSEYGIWTHMIQRCTNPNRHSYPDYGGRGIKVCKRWRKSFRAFYEDMGPRPSVNYSLDRIDVNRDYEPHNCRWATADIQTNNARSNRRIIFNGQNLTVAQWAKKLGLPKETLYARLNKGWETEHILNPKRER
jgi:hypothetical protein